MPQTPMPAPETETGTDPVSQWGLVIEGFQATNDKIHAAVASTFSLDRAEAETLLRLANAAEQRKPMAAIAREAQFTSGGFTKVADRLTERGLAERARCTVDRRVIYLELTAAGAELAEDLSCLISDLVRSIYTDVLGAERAQLVAEAMAELRAKNLT
ncbi:MarR family transcriptional regulator [Brevibacterium daeguense]|uniref:MarR family transcriptional regulator n=1 Tax=Brevibacterium daeguense TaxID=909936 RepID=A0ABP8EKH8_9MICO|nr:MarR family winged helix-turn-helix transcriptional regulator [Brevibacterium daeguense]